MQEKKAYACFQIRDLLIQMFLQVIVTENFQSQEQKFISKSSRILLIFRSVKLFLLYNIGK